MAERQNLSKVETNLTGKAGLITDLNSSYMNKETYSYARNLVRNSQEGDLLTLGNEPSLIRCWSAPYKIIGTIPLPDNSDLVFSTDDTNSEIGVGNADTCEYTKLLNLPCLGFSQKNLITGEAKKLFGKDIVVTFIDKKNGIRRIDLSKISSIQNCDDTLLFKKISTPCISVEKGFIGNVPNGTYSIAMAYSIDNQRFTNWIGLTTRLQVYSETSANSFTVAIEDLDDSFDQFQLLVVGNYIDPVTKGATKVARVVGSYSTKTKKIFITDFINNDYPVVPLSEVVLEPKTWLNAGIISSNSNLLVLGDLVGRKEENYQLKAMQIEAEYVVEQVLADYYEVDGRDVSHYRDENYSYIIRGVYNTQERTNGFHISGRLPDSSDLSLVSSSDVFEFDQNVPGCKNPDKIFRFQVENTAGKLIQQNNEFSCGRRILGTGRLGYHQSTDLYPDNPHQFGDYANTPIRYHKFPDECKVPRTSVVNGKTYINILGIRFKNIPKFDDPDIIGYEILRADRKGGNGTVVARGIMTNTRYYDDPNRNQRILYSNYTVNNLGPDPYLSSTQTVYKNSRETNYTPLTNYFTDKFNFYSPHTSFSPKYTLGNYLSIETEEVADVKGKFSLVYNHPKQKLLNQFAFWVAAAVGFIESSLILLGKTNINTGSKSEIEADASIPPSVSTTKVTESSSSIEIKTVEDLISLSPGQIVGAVVNAAGSLNGGGLVAILNLIQTAISGLIALGVKPAYAVFSGIKEANEILDTINNFTGYTDYVYQYDAHANFNQSLCINSGNKRRGLIRNATYIPSDLVSINDLTFNNIGREQSVLLELNKPIVTPKTKDTSTNTISGFGICDNINQEIRSVGSAYYVTSKVTNPNQYGQLGSTSFVKTHSCPFSFTKDIEESPIIYGGDCVIQRFQVQKRMKFFSQDLADNSFSPGTEYDYRKYANIAYPRYWMDSSKYDFSQLLSSQSINFARFNRTTASKYNLDCKKRNDGGSITRIDDAYMYLYNNVVLDFFVECDYNISFREPTERPHYSKNNQDLSKIFRSDNLKFPEEFNISRVYSDIYTTEVFAQQQRTDFDPTTSIPEQQPNSVIYSLPSFNLQQADNWQYFLPANFFSFKESDFGKLTGIHKLDQDRLIFLFSKSSPYISMGREILTLDGTGRKVTIGDGGLFAQDPREVMPTDTNYGACSSPYAFSNTHMGRFYPSENQGMIHSFEENKIPDISQYGISYWCKLYMPIQLYDSFPNYPKEENPISGVGYLSVFDASWGVYYLTKRDFMPLPEYSEDITYLNGSFYYKNQPISLNSQYFKDISWTISYSPSENSFISWHDWHPDWVIQKDRHFMTIKDNASWKHNEATDSFCNFYGTDYPFEIEFVHSTGQQVTTIRNIEYLLEAYKYKNFGRNRFHVFGENFDRFIVHNSEQISPLLNLITNPLNPEERENYPKRNLKDSISWDVLFSKEENKYRVSQFWDSTKDRGEFTNSEFHLLPTDESGYKSIINPLAINVNKPEEQRKKFRHYFNKFRFIKTTSGSTKFLVKLFNIKTLSSLR